MATPHLSAFNSRSLVAACGMIFLMLLGTSSGGVFDVSAAAAPLPESKRSSVPAQEKKPFPSDMSIDAPTSSVVRASSASEGGRTDLEVTYSYQDAQPDTATIILEDGVGNRAFYGYNDTGEGGNVERTDTLDLTNPSDGTDGNGLVDGSAYDISLLAVDADGNQESITEPDLLTVDNTAPSAPENVTASAVADGDIEVSFDDVDEDDGSGVTSYSIQRSASSGGSYSEIGTISDDDSDSYTLTDTDPADGDTLYYVVSALDVAENESAPSAEASATTETTSDSSPPENVSLDAPTSSVVRASSSANGGQTSLDVSYSYEESNPDVTTITIEDGSGNQATFDVDDSGYAGDGSSKTETLDLSSPDSGDLSTEATYDINVTATDADGQSTSDESSGADVLTIDNTPPQLQSATVTDDLLTVSYDETLDDGSVPAPDAFAVRVNGSSQSVSSVDIASGATDVELTLGSAVSPSDDVELDYTPGSNPIRDVGSENEADGFSNQSVTNDTEDTTAPAAPVGVSGETIAASNVSSYSVDVELVDDHEGGTLTARLTGPNGGEVTASTSVSGENDGDDQTRVVTISDIDATSLDDGTVTLDARLTDTAGNESDFSSESTVTKDTSPPSIDSFTATNPQDQDVEITIETDEGLGDADADIEVAISGAESATLTRSDFSESGSFTYTATYSGSSGGTYTATLNVARDPAGNDGADGETAETTVDASAPTVTSVSLGNDGANNLDLQFETDEALASLAVSVDGPDTDDVYSFDETDFNETNNGDGTFTYELSETQAYDQGSGTYTAAVDDAIDAAGNDGADGSATDTYTLPAVRDTTLATDEDTPISDGAPGILANDSDPDELSVSAINGTSGDVGTQITLGSGALLTVNADGSYDYDPNGAFESLTGDDSDSDSFTYTAVDTEGGSGQATVTIDVSGVNDSPMVETNEVLTVETTGGTAALTTDELSASDPDDGPGALTYTVTESPSNGSILLDGSSTSSFTQQDIVDGLVEYTHDGSETALDDFTFDLTDDDGAGPTDRTFEIAIALDNQSPTATNDEASTSEDDPLEVTNASNGLLANDSDPDGDDLSVSAVNGVSDDVGTELTLSSGALLTVNGDGTYTYDPNGAFDDLAADESESESFSYTASDGRGGSDQATVTITVNGVNDAPTLDVNDGITVGAGGTSAITTDELTASDPDDDASSLEYAVSTSPSQGQLLVDGSEASTFTQQQLQDGVIEYEHTADTADDDSFTFDLTDDDGAGPTDQTFTITVEAGNQPPTAENDTYSTDEDQTLSVSDPSNGVLANDSDPDGDNLQSSLVSTPSNGSLTLNSDGTFEYTPESNYNGTDSFTYEARDGNGGTDQADVTITVNAVNDAPTLTTNEGLTTGVGATVTLTTSDLSASDVDDDASDLEYTITSGPSQGQILVQDTETSSFTQQQIENGTVQYEHTADADNDDSFTFDLTDDDGAGPADQTFSITIMTGNQAPTAQNDTYSTDEDQTLSVSDPSNGVLANDSDPEDDDLEAALVSTPSNGSLTLNSDGTFEYTPESNYNGTDEFTYQARDGRGGTDQAEVTLTVNPVNDPPQIETNDGLTVVEGDTAPITTAALSASDVDDEPSALEYTLTAGPSQGQILVEGTEASSFTQQQLENEEVEYEHTAGTNEDDSFTFDLTDDDGAGPTDRTFSISVSGDNASPVATDDRYVTDQAQTLSVDDPSNGVLANDSDPDEDPLQASVVTPPSNGSLTLDEDGTFEYTPNSTFNGTDEFTYEVSDGRGATDRSTVEIRVRPGQTNVSITRTFPNPTQQQSFRLVALPGASETPLASTLSGQSGDDWRAFREQGASGSSTYGREECETDTECSLGPGTGYWLIARTPWSVEDSVETVPLEAGSTDTAPIYRISLHEGWNIISNPLETDVSWSAVQEASGTNQALWRWNGSWEQAQTLTSAADGEAYYFMDDQIDELVLPFPGLQADRIAASSVRAPAPSERAPTLSLHLVQNDDTLSTVQVGRRSGAAVGLDRTDRYGPPAYFGSPSLRLITSRGDREYSLVAEHTPPGRQGDVFNLQLRANADTALTIVADGAASFGNDQIALMRRSDGRHHDLRSGSPAAVRPDSQTTRYRLLIGSEAFVEDRREDVAPSTTSLLPNYPNPFRRATTLEYSLPERQEVRLEVYDVLGRRVDVLVQETQRAGFHRVQWQGRSRGGQPVASGVYFARLVTESSTKTERLVVVR